VGEADLRSLASPRKDETRSENERNQANHPIYTIVQRALGTKKHWNLIKNGKIIPLKNNTKLYEQLDKCKNHLNPEQYKVEDIIIVKNEMPLTLVFGGY
jgi:hypothetical protein